MNILITGVWHSADKYFNICPLCNHKIIFQQNETDSLTFNPDEIDAVICQNFFSYHDISLFTNLKYIQVTSAGVDKLPLDYIQKHDIVLKNARGVYSIPIAENVISGVLQLYKNSAFFIKNQAEHIWQKNREMRELFGKKILVIGCGSVGTECAKRFKAFGCTVIGVDTTLFENDSFDEIKPLSDINNMISSADIVVLTLPLTESTYHFFDSEKMSLLPDNTVLVNVSRGGIVDNDALLSNIDRLFGAVLDVFENEPLSSDSPLWDKQNILVTPHNSFVGEGNEKRLSDLILDNLTNYFIKK